MGTKGIGRLYFRGQVVWFQISIRGTRYRISTEITGDPKKPIPREAELWRARKLVELGQGGSIRSDQITFDDLADSLVSRYKAEQRQSLSNTVTRLRPLREHFGTWRAVEVRASSMAAYAAKRRDVDGAAVATINLEIALAARAYSIAMEDGLIGQAPKFHVLPGANVRQGVIEEDQFKDIAQALPEKYRSFAWFLRLTGWRRSEPCRLRWTEVSWEANDLLLKRSKTGKPRRLPFGTYRSLHSLLQRQREHCDELQGKLGRIIEWVFPQPDGTQISDGAFYGAWKIAREVAGCPKATPHDLRRSIARKGEKSRIRRSALMALMGVQTEDVFRRYAVLTTSDLEDELEQLSEVQEESKVKKGKFGG